jgi:hypothetical protein
LIFTATGESEIQGGVIAAKICTDRYRVDMVEGNDSGLSWLPVWCTKEGRVRRCKDQPDGSTRLEKVIEGSRTKLRGFLIATWRPDEATMRRLEDQNII